MAGPGYSTIAPPVPLQSRPTENIVVVVGKQLQSVNFMLFLKKPIFLRKFPLIKLQIHRQTGQAKAIAAQATIHSMAALFFPPGHGNGASFKKVLSQSAILGTSGSALDTSNTGEQG